MQEAFLALYEENPPLGGGFKKAYSFAYVIKTPFDLLVSACGLATAVGNKSKGGPPWVTLKV